MSKQWIKRTTEPDVNSKYYTTKAGKGINGCIQGNAKTNKVKNRQATYSVMPNCTGYAHARSLEIMRATEPCSEIPTCNAEDWNDMCKWEHGQTPKLGAIACWRCGKNWNGNDGCGHVAIVEEVYSNGDFLVSESGWTGWYFRTTRIAANKFYGSGLTFECFLYNPYADRNFEEVKAPDPVAPAASGFLPAKGYWKYGDKDARIGQLCQYFYDYFPAYATLLKRNKKNLLGNLFGDNLLAWVKEFQKRTSDEAYQLLGNGQDKGKFIKNYADGNVGKQTYTMLKKYGFKL